MGKKAAAGQSALISGSSTISVQKAPETFTVPTGWGLVRIAEHLNVTVEALKEANADKLKTWGSVQGFNQGAIITVPASAEVTLELTPEQKIDKVFNDYKSGNLNMPDFARALLPFSINDPVKIISVFDDLSWSSTDNLAYALAANSNDSFLARINSALLKRMSSALGTLLTTARAANLEQKTRIDRVIGVNDKESSEDNNEILNSEARQEAIDFVNQNKEAYLKGKERWESGTKNGDNFNNVLIVHKDNADGNHVKVYRKFSGGVYTLIDKETLNDSQYETEKALATASNTYCNIAATKIGLEYGSPNLQNHGGQEHNANSMYDNFNSGFYDTETHIFKKVSFEEAESYANKGGLVYAIWKNEGGIGHIGTVIGGYGGDGTKKMANIKIFQAGSTFGEMNYSQGFGANRVSDFYIWIKK